MSDQGTDTPSASTSDQTKVLGPLAAGLAAGLIVVYVLAMIYVVDLRADADWERIYLIFAGLEALVFAGAGALFGTKIERKSTAAETKRADDATKKAEKEHEEAVAGRMLATAIRTKASGSRNVQDAGDMAELRQMVEELYGR